MFAESQNCETRREPLLGDGYVNAPIARQWLNISQVITATDTHATIEYFLDAMFSVQFVRSLYNEHQLPL
jgi:hypothetical protein